MCAAESLFPKKKQPKTSIWNSSKQFCLWPEGVPLSIDEFPLIKVQSALEGFCELHVRVDCKKNVQQQLKMYWKHVKMKRILNMWKLPSYFHLTVSVQKRHEAGPKA